MQYKEINSSPDWKNNLSYEYPDSEVQGANMGPTWVLSAPDGPHVGPMNLAIRVIMPKSSLSHYFQSVHNYSASQLSCTRFALCCGLFFGHDDVIKWRNFPRYWPFVRGIHRSPVNSPHKGQWRGALMFSLIYARINGWVNNRESGDLSRPGAHYDVRVMTTDFTPTSHEYFTDTEITT